ncbi:50S ribosomal protein L9 [Senegalimassilia anaerobia]|uniref:50S ribosomal protein L9 n=1 Tax=Senegalimassilia anaerobia TaxID=1473216 RepID=UPI003A9845CA
MKVILLQELKGKGGEGDVVDVAPGFANNYLMPQGIAILATKGNLKQLEMRKNNIAKREATRLADAEKLKSVLDGASVKVDAKVGEEGQLFGSVTATQIAEAIKEALGVEIDRRRVEAGKAIKTAGQHEVVISIYRDIKATVTLLVGIDEAVAEEEAEEVETEAVAEEAAAEEAAE